MADCFDGFVVGADLEAAFKNDACDKFRLNGSRCCAAANALRLWQDTAGGALSFVFDDVGEANSVQHNRMAKLRPVGRTCARTLSSTIGIHRDGCEFCGPLRIQLRSLLLVFLASVAAVGLLLC